MRGENVVEEYEAARTARVVEGGLSFSVALQIVKGGHRVQRAGWNGKGMYVRLAQVEGVLPFLALRTVQGDLIPWMVSQADVLAEDWEALSE
jgi:hypothetical protein